MQTSQRVIRVGVAVVLFLAVSEFLPADELRTWISTDGKFTVEAVLVSVDANRVRLRRSDGQELVVPLRRLSEEDREYVKRAKDRPSSKSYATSAELLAGLPEWKRRRVALDQLHQVEEFRIFYTLTGHDALPDPTDSNENGVPDKVENIAIQLVVARSVYVDAMKLQHPLQSLRYKDKAKFIDVHVARMPLDPGAKKVNGQAGDGIINYNRTGDPEGGFPVLTIDISNDLAFDNLTPAHELFHLFQYGYTMFKNPWFLEGMARWAEFALRKGAGQAGHLPRDKQELAELFSAEYEASKFWYTVAALSDPRGRLSISSNLRRTTYIGTRQRVIEDDILFGTDFMRQLLERLGEADDAVTEERALKPFEWKESQQRLPENNTHIWAATVDVIREYARRSPELKMMLRTIGTSN